MSPEQCAVLLADAINEWGGCFFHCGDDGYAFDVIRPMDDLGATPGDRIAKSLSDLVEFTRLDERARRTH